MRRMRFQGEYRGFLLWQEAGSPDIFVRDAENQWLKCRQERFRSFQQAEEYVDFVIDHYQLNKPAKPRPGTPGQEPHRPSSVRSGGVK